MGIKDETPFGAYSKDGNFTTDDSTQKLLLKEMKMKNLRVNDIVLITDEYSNGRRNRTVGIVKSFEKSKNGKGVYAVLNPLSEDLAKPIREKYCTSEYNYQGAINCYSDKFGFGCHTLTNENTVILGTCEIKPVPKMWYPEPGNTGYDLMC